MPSAGDGMRDRCPALGWRESVVRMRSLAVLGALARDGVLGGREASPLCPQHVFYPYKVHFLPVLVLDVAGSFSGRKEGFSSA